MESGLKQIKWMVRIINVQSELCHWFSIWQLKSEVLPPFRAELFFAFMTDQADFCWFMVSGLCSWSGWKWFISGNGLKLLLCGCGDYTEWFWKEERGKEVASPLLKIPELSFNKKTCRNSVPHLKEFWECILPQYYGFLITWCQISNLINLNLVAASVLCVDIQSLLKSSFDDGLYLQRRNFSFHLPVSRKFKAPGHF